MELTPEQYKLLVEALVSAYVEFKDLLMRLKLDLGWSLTDDISPDLPKRKGADAVATWATTEGKIAALVDTLLKDKPGSPKVIAFRESLGGAPPRPQPLGPSEQRIAEGWSGKASGLEAIVVADNKLEQAVDWEASMKEARGRVCKIQAGDQAIGTGFLVGRDLILTNCHVYRGLEQLSAETPIARFDYYSKGAAGKTYEIQMPAKAVSTADKLDFALLQLDSAVEPERGKFVPKKHLFKEDQIQLILQHPDGKPMQIGIGRVKTVDDLHKGVWYDANTEAGSSGSPVFTMNWELVAIHHYGQAESNRGIPIEPIWELLREKGHIL